ncbi:MAG TPA: GNAT family N-acetyltransferase [Longimicrobiales bacterium]|nr:GNAT family N-acetyltransferase [Longimicrobiales bacterium]
MTPAALPVLDHRNAAWARPQRRPPLAIVRDTPAATLRPAAHTDAPALHALLDAFVASGALLPRSRQDVVRDIGEYIVAVVDGQVVGSVAVRRRAPELAEVGALAVAAHLQGAGLGRRLVEAAVDCARNQGVSRVFALTLQDEFFYRIGFAPANIGEFPQKIAADCSRCARRADCREIAVAMPLTKC